MNLLDVRVDDRRRHGFNVICTGRHQFTIISVGRQLLLELRHDAEQLIQFDVQPLQLDRQQKILVLDVDFGRREVDDLRLFG